MKILGPLTVLTFVLALPGGAGAQWTNTGGGDHGKADWTITNGTQIAGVHTGVAVLTIPAGATVTIAPYDGAAFGRVEIQCEAAVIEGDLLGTAAGFRGGNSINPLYDGENATQGGTSGTVFATNGGGGGGGGHGGPGGNGAVNGIGAGPGGGQAGAAGSFTARMGGGGGSGAAIPDGFSTAPIGGNGGAGIKIIADPGSITVNGSIIVNGTDGQPEPTIGFSAGGGGAGGGIVLMSTCGSVINSGILGADGGAFTIGEYDQLDRVTSNRLDSLAGLFAGQECSILLGKCRQYRSSECDDCYTKGSTHECPLFAKNSTLLGH